MKKYLLTLLTAISSCVAFAQSSQTKSEKINFSTHETESEHSLKASFPTARAERVYATFVNVLGEANRSSTKENVWIGSTYSATLTPTGFKASLDKEKASVDQITMFKRLNTALHKALGQSPPPQPSEPGH